MRPDQADETDGADEGHGGGGQQADPQQRAEAQPADVDAQRQRAFLAQAQRGHRPGRAQAEGQHQQHHNRQRLHRRPARAGPAAEAPEHQLLQGIRRGQVLQQRDQRVVAEHQGDAEQQKGLHAAGETRHRLQQEHRGEGEDEGVEAHQPAVRHAGNAEAEDDGQRRAERGGGGHAKGEGAGQRVVEDGLHLRPGQRQGDAHQYRHQGERQAQFADDHQAVRVHRLRAEQRAEHLAESERGGAGGDVGDQAGEQCQPQQQAQQQTFAQDPRVRFAQGLGSQLGHVQNFALTLASTEAGSP